eukprot:3535728-Amphidinium_carterae.1
MASRSSNKACEDETSKAHSHLSRTIVTETHLKPGSCTTKLALLAPRKRIIHHPAKRRPDKMSWKLPNKPIGHLLAVGYIWLIGWVHPGLLLQRYATLGEAPKR